MPIDPLGDHSEDEDYNPSTVSMSEWDSEDVFDEEDDLGAELDGRESEKDDLASELAYILQDGCEEISYVEAQRCSTKSKSTAKARDATTTAAHAAAKAKATAKAKTAAAAAANNAANTASDAAAANKTSPDIILTAHHYSLLRGHVAKLRNAPSAVREKIFEEATNDIKRNWVQGVEFDRKVVETLVNRYMTDKAREMKNKPMFGMRKKWTYLDVVRFNHSDEIGNLAVETSGSKRGSPAYIAAYKPALMDLEKTLSEEVRIKYKSDAMKWTEESPPRTEQHRLLQKYSMRAFREFSEAVFLEYGMRVVIMAGYQDPQDETSVLLFENDQIGGTPFKSRNKHWQSYPMFKEFSNWIQESFEGAPINGSALSQKKKDSSGVPDITFETDKDGYPVLPSLETLERESLYYRKVFMGRYMSRMYQIAVGKLERVPWDRMIEDQGKFIDPEYLPDGLLLSSNNHKFKKQVVDAILKHWTTRDAEGNIPFRFKNPDKADRCRKREYTIANVQSSSTPQSSLATNEGAGGEEDTNRSDPRSDSPSGDPPDGSNLPTNLAGLTPDVLPGSASRDGPHTNQSTDNKRCHSPSAIPRAENQRENLKGGSKVNPKKRKKNQQADNNVDPRRSERRPRPTARAAGSARK